MLEKHCYRIKHCVKTWYKLNLNVRIWGFHGGGGGGGAGAASPAAADEDMDFGTMAAASKFTWCQNPEQQLHHKPQYLTCCYLHAALIYYFSVCTTSNWR